MSNWRKVTIPVFLIVSVALLSGFAYRSDTFFLIKKNFTIFSEVFQEVSTRYVDDVDPEKLVRHGINSMLELLDPYTVLIDEADHQNFEILTTGRYAGVGIEVGSRGGRLVIIAPIEGYSAHQRGIRAGDIILEVDGFSVANYSVDDLQGLISGEPGTNVEITVERFGFDQPLVFELTRENVEIRNITYSGFLDAGKTIGYVSLARFGQNASGELRQVINGLKSEGNLQSLVLDLRNNPGGLLDEAVKIVDKFVGPGQEVVRTKGRSFESTFISRTEEPAIFEGNLVILQNNGSASSSEIVAGALQDLDRAVIVGDRSFGKGLVQIIRPLSYNVALKITTSRYYIPSGRSIQSVIYDHETAISSHQVSEVERNAFKTKIGRTVYDGVGIDPDVLISDRSHALVEIALLQNSSYFFFANEFSAENPDNMPPQITDEIFAEFMEYLERTSFDYTTRSERYISQLRTQIESEGIPGVSENLMMLESAIQAQKRQDIILNEESIRRELYLELISRYHGPSGKIEASFPVDPAVQKALELLSDKKAFAAILSP